MIHRLAYALASLLPTRTLLRIERRLSRPPFISGHLRRAVEVVLRLLRGGEVTVSHGLASGLRFDAHGQAATLALGVHDPQAQAALGELLREGMTFYDLGANAGFFSLIGARLVGPTGRVVAFEPIPELAEAIERNAAANRMANVVVFRQAVADRSGPAEFELVVDDRGLTGSHLAGVRPTVPGDLRIPVEAVALDDLVAGGVIPPPDVVKLDVEGAELAAVRGMAGIAREQRPALVAELHGDQSELLRLLDELGYAVRSLDPDGPTLTQNPQIVALPRERAGATPTAG